MVNQKFFVNNSTGVRYRKSHDAHLVRSPRTTVG